MATCVGHGKLMFIVSTIQSVSIDGSKCSYIAHMEQLFFQSKLRSILGLEFC
jgi:hypothetical protein